MHCNLSSVCAAVGADGKIETKLNAYASTDAHK